MIVENVRNPTISTCLQAAVTKRQRKDKVCRINSFFSWGNLHRVFQVCGRLSRSLPPLRFVAFSTEFINGIRRTTFATRDTGWACVYDINEKFIVPSHERWSRNRMTRARRDVTIQPEICFVRLFFVKMLRNVQKNSVCQIVLVRKNW